MTGRVIQGFFPTGQVKVSPSVLQTARSIQMTAASCPPPGTRHVQVPQSSCGRETLKIDPARLGLLTGGGQALPQGVREKMESALGADFSPVRVHTGPQAERLGALAFTVGTDIYFAPGRYQPESMQGRQLLGHELAHVIQQRQGRVRAAGGGLSLVQDRALEVEAEGMGQRAAARLTAAAKPSAAPLQPKMQANFSRMAQPDFPRRNVPVPPIPGNLPVSGNHVLQAKGGKKALAALAAPKVFPGPDIEAQAEIVKALEQKVTEGKFPIDDKKPKGVVCLGAVELPIDLNAEKSVLISQAKLIKLPNVTLKSAIKENVFVTGSFPDSAVDQHFELVENDLALQGHIKRLVIGTMIAAGQIDYLKTVDWYDQGFKILVEVHYYRERDPQQQGLHKDTLGQTLFVTLNFVSDEDIVGPEYLLNPAPIEKHEEQLKQTLPPAFQKHLKKVREGLSEPIEFGATVVKPNYAVSFVDELVHHKTPTYGHREVSGSDLGSFLGKKYSAEYAAAKKRAAWNFWNTVDYLWSNAAYYSYLSTQATNENLKWDVWFKLASQTQRKFDRPFLRGKGFPDPLIDELLESNYKFKIASVPNSQRSAVTGKPFPAHSGTLKPEGKAPLKRRMSMLALEGKLPPLPSTPKPRRFFRTWVRAVPI